MGVLLMPPQEIRKKNLLLLDAHISHIYNLIFIRLMTKNGIEVLAIPVKTSYILQTLDSTPFANFKTALNNSLIELLFKNVECKMTKQDFCVVFWPTWSKSIKPLVIHSGFQKTGVFPYNPAMIKCSALATSDVTDNLTQIQGKDCCRVNW